MPSPRFHQSAFEHEDEAMSAKKPAADDKKATTVVANDRKGTLKSIGGSQSDLWNNMRRSGFSSNAAGQSDEPQLQPCLHPHDWRC
jgi:hypothetical protein